MVGTSISGRPGGRRAWVFHGCEHGAGVLVAYVTLFESQGPQACRSGRCGVAQSMRWSRYGRWAARVIAVMGVGAVATVAGARGAAPQAEKRVSTIAFVTSFSKASLRWNLYLGAADGSWRETLAQRVDGLIEWSPDGRGLAFTRDAGISVLDVATGQKRTLWRRRGHEAKEDLEWSPDGRRILFVTQDSAGRWHLWLVNADGTKARIIARDIDIEGIGTGSSYRSLWSPDSRKIAFSIGTLEHGQVVVHDVRTGVKRALWTGRKGDTAPDAPVWSPNGQKLAFGVRDRGLFVVEGDGGNPKLLTRLQPLDWLWTRDGREILAVVGNQRPGRYEQRLIAFAPGGAGRRRLARSASVDRVALSPDGRTIAFDTESTTRDIHMVNLDGTGERRRTATRHADWLPVRHPDLAWSPDGRRLGFLRGTDFDPAQWPLWTVATTGNARRAVAALVYSWRWRPSPPGR